MRSGKRYSIATISKRVDHEAGRHRTPRAPAEPATCGICGAAYSERRWTLAVASRRQDKHKAGRPGAITICPACKTKQNATPAGFVYVSGDFFGSHRHEIEHLLENEAERAMLDNPLARIMSSEKDEDGRLVIRTTTEHLAQRLGKALEKAFAGKVRYNFSHENKLTRVYWHRD
jgi:hypothetical protein